MKLYGLYSEKQDCYMAMSFASNSEGEFCSPVEISLCKYFNGDALWVSPNPDEAAEITELGSSKWFNADFLRPKWDEKRFGPLKVIDLETEEILNIHSTNFKNLKEKNDYRKKRY